MMTKGPAGVVDRPFAETRLKYDVRVEAPSEIYKDPPKAADLLDMRVNAVQKDSNEFIKDTIGDVILAANRLASPSTARLVDEVHEPFRDDNLVSDPDNVEVTLTYAIDGYGIGEAANTRTRARYMKDLYVVLVEENDEPIKNSAVQREWSPEPYEVQGVKISTD